MACRVITTAHDRIALRLQWMLDGKSVRSQEALGVHATAKNLAAAKRDFADRISAEIRACAFDRMRYLEWFPNGAKAECFRRDLGLVVQSVPKRAVGGVSLRDWYDRWIAMMKPPFVRRSRERDYTQHMTAYVLPALGNEAVAELDVERLDRLRRDLLERERPLSEKTIRNVVGGTLRACLRDAVDAGLATSNPAAKLKWKVLPRSEADPFTAEERDKILVYFAERVGGFYFPLNSLLFSAGLRPSEAVALRVGDVELSGWITVRLSRHLKEESAPKTERSRRRIAIPSVVVEVLRPLIEGRAPDEHLFLHMKGGPIDQGQWPKDYWKTALEKLQIRHRKWYATRHTFISLALTKGAEMGALAKYCGTSVHMIDRNYGKSNPGNERAILASFDLPGIPKTQRSKASVAFRSEKRRAGIASPTGFEDISASRRRGPRPYEKPTQEQILAACVSRELWGFVERRSAGV